MRTTTLILTCLLALSLAPFAAADCTSYTDGATVPTGTLVEATVGTCASSDGGSSHANADVQDDLTGESVWLSAGSYRWSQTWNGSSSSSEGRYLGLGTYNDRGNLVPSASFGYGSWESSWNDTSYSWSYAYGHVAWGPFYQSVGGPVPTLS